MPGARGPGRDPDRARKRLLAFLLRHSLVYRAGSYWTAKHPQWLSGQRFDERALDATIGHYRAVLVARDAAVDAIATSILTRHPSARPHTGHTPRTAQPATP